MSESLKAHLKLATTELIKLLQRGDMKCCFAVTKVDENRKGIVMAGEATELIAVIVEAMQRDEHIDFCITTAAAASKHYYKVEQAFENHIKKN